MADSVIDRFYTDHKVLSQYLSERAEPSFAGMIDDDFRKLLALSVASFFEHTITDAILRFCSIKADGDSGLYCLVRMKAVERQYATYFDWNGKTANPFFKLFGDALGGSMRNDVKNNTGLKAGCEAFLELGNVRNRLVHQNFASFAFEKTADEVYDEYKLASKFVDYVVARLSEEEDHDRKGGSPSETANEPPPQGS
jgi:hypothetical protein